MTCAVVEKDEEPLGFDIEDQEVASITKGATPLAEELIVSPCVHRCRFELLQELLQTLFHLLQE